MTQNAVILKTPAVTVILRSEATKDLPEPATPMPLRPRACPERSEGPVLSEAKEKDPMQLVTS